MSQRRRAREVALQILFEDDVNTRGTVAELEEFLHGRLNNPAMERFSQELIFGTRKRMDEIDARLGEIAANWSLKRMSGTDRNVLRLATYEILYTETPFRVVVNEAIELAKRFGAGQSGPFVNGILDKLKKSSKAES